jgi:hypothetical protein
MAARHGLDLRSRVTRTSKEVARHVLHRLGVKRKFGYLQPEKREQRFAQIYEQRVWAHGDDAVPGSGRGSTLDATTGIREALPGLLDRLGCETLMDLGCGDFTWMREVELGRPYIGVDLVAGVIEENIRRFGADDRSFIHADAAVDPLPAADVVLCREVLFHLSFDDIRKVLENVFSQPRRYLIATTDEVTVFNSNIRSGDYRFLNLRRAPFRFGEPVASLSDTGVAASRQLAVWPVRQVCEAMGLPSVAPRQSDKD